MATEALCLQSKKMLATTAVFHHLPTSNNSFHQTPKSGIHINPNRTILSLKSVSYQIRCCTSTSPKQEQQQPSYQTCKNCKTQFDPSLNHPTACRFHTAHFGGETKRKFESVYSGGTMSTPNAGQVFQYWHCCGSEDPFDPGCTAAPHSSYDD